MSSHRDPGLKPGVHSPGCAQRAGAAANNPWGAGATRYCQCCCREAAAEQFLFSCSAAQGNSCACCLPLKLKLPSLCLPTSAAFVSKYWQNPFSLQLGHRGMGSSVPLACALGNRAGWQLSPHCFQRHQQVRVPKESAWRRGILSMISGLGYFPGLLFSAEVQVPSLARSPGQVLGDIGSVPNCYSLLSDPGKVYSSPFQLFVCKHVDVFKPEWLG